MDELFVPSDDDEVWYVPRGFNGDGPIVEVLLTKDGEAIAGSDGRRSGLNNGARLCSFDDDELFLR